MDVLVEFKGSHHYIRQYESCDLYCPNCCSKSVYEEQSEGDYYLGPGYICIACDNEFTIQGPYKRDQNISRQIRSGVCDLPTTPKGR